MPDSRNDSLSSAASQRTFIDEPQPAPPSTSVAGGPTEISPTITVAPNTVYNVSPTKQALNQSNSSACICCCQTTEQTSHLQIQPGKPAPVLPEPKAQPGPVTGVFVADNTTTGFREIKVSTVQDMIEKVGSQHKIVLVKANANVLRKCQACKDALCAAFNMPRLWWGDEMKRANGFFGSEEEWSEGETLTAYRTWCRFMAKHCDTSSKYKWIKINMYTRTEFQTKRTVILSFETHQRLDFAGNYSLLSEQDKNGQCKTSMQEQLLTDLNDTDLSDPYWMYRPLLQSFLYIQERAIWKVRDLVRVCESDGKKDIDSDHANFADMHVISRHAIHVSETLLLTVESLQQMVESHGELYRMLANTKVRADGAYVLQDDDGDGDKAGLRPRQKVLQSRMRSALMNHRNTFSALNLRASATQQRLQSEIQLAFNVTTQVDSRAMRNISLLTMVFLPSTFVATIFSTTFFSVDNNEWVMNDQFWIFWAFAIPVTVLVMLWWYFIQERQLSTSAILGIDKRRERKAAEEKAKLAERKQVFQGIRARTTSARGFLLPS